MGCGVVAEEDHLDALRLNKFESQVHLFDFVYHGLGDHRRAFGKQPPVYRSMGADPKALKVLLAVNISPKEERRSQSVQLRAGCSTVDAIHSARLLIEKHREKQTSVHIAFLELEKGFDREVIWYALRQHGVPGELIDWVRILYSSPKSRVPAAAGTSMEFPVSVGVHRGSALFPLLFVVVMDAITRDLQKPVAWTLLYVDDVVLASEDKDKLEREVQAWYDRLERFGLKLNVKKTEYLTTDVTESSSIKVNGIELPRTSVFKYLSSHV
ncbi:unnamed protein product [Heligmosomoides polygyrus]|uniref:Reverse transcriptase domain-containing protein n=1 Tax=Heligmosomoides polygyrus TaxID=6339 RepID=A0A183FKP1_HELPZ|nr:unnamed protein product [Heligmosomoides polygyrus]